MNADNAPAITITHIPLTREVYNMLLSALETEEYENGRHSTIDDARRWLHYRWLVEHAKQECTQ